MNRLLKTSSITGSTGADRDRARLGADRGEEQVAAFARPRPPARLDDVVGPVPG
jgi:hypothetical protein